MKNKLLQIRNPLLDIVKMFSKFGMELQFTSERRNNPSFEPEDVYDMISCYPLRQFQDIRKVCIHEDTGSKQESMASIIMGIHEDRDRQTSEEMIVVDENEESELITQDINDMIEEYSHINTGWNTRSGIMVVIDEMYLDTLLSKRDLIDNMSERLAKDLVPVILDYIKTANNVIDKLKTILIANPYFDAMKTKLSCRSDYRHQYTQSAYFSRNKRVDGAKINDNDGFYRDDALIVDAVLSLYFMECINVCMKGKDIGFIRNFDLNVTRIFETAYSESALCKAINITSLVISILGNQYNGTAFEMLLRGITNTANNNGTYKCPLLEDNVLRFNIYCDDSSKANASRQILNDTKTILKYAETTDILSALIMNKENALEIFAEGFSNKNNDAKDLKRAIEISRKASLVMVELEFINTKYSKKDALSQAYTIKQEALTLQTKLKSEKAIDIIDVVISNIDDKIRETQSTDHKHRRSTINIAYPSGYEG